jgi:hypothetical protein
MKAYCDHSNRTTVRFLLLLSPLWLTRQIYRAPGSILTFFKISTDNILAHPLCAVPCTFPPLLVKPSKSFEQFYLSRHSERKLKWSPYCSSRILGRENTSHTRKSKDATAIPDNEQRNLQPLACTKFKGFKKHSPGREVNPEDSFSFNADFSQYRKSNWYCTVTARVESGEEHKERMLKGVHNTGYESPQGNDT